MIVEFKNHLDVIIFINQNKDKKFLVSEYLLYLIIKTDIIFQDYLIFFLIFTLNEKNQKDLNHILEILRLVNININEQLDLINKENNKKFNNKIFSLNRLISLQSDSKIIKILTFLNEIINLNFVEKIDFLKRKKDFLFSKINDNFFDFLSHKDMAKFSKNQEIEDIIIQYLHINFFQNLILLSYNLANIDVIIIDDEIFLNRSISYTKNLEIINQLIEKNKFVNISNDFLTENSNQLYSFEYQNEKDMELNELLKLEPIEGNLFEKNSKIEEWLSKKPTLYPSHINLLNTNPKIFFALRVLKIEKYKLFLDSNISAKNIGNCVHEIFALFAKEVKKNDVIISEELFYIIACSTLDRYEINYKNDLYWKKYIEFLSKKAIEIEENRIKNNREIFNIESFIGYEFEEFKLSAYPDRIEVDKLGNFFIFDFKSGKTLPTSTEEKNGTKLQLGIIGLILKKNFPNINILKAEYVSLALHGENKEIEEIEEIIKTTEENLFLFIKNIKEKILTDEYFLSQNVDSQYYDFQIQEIKYLLDENGINIFK